MSVEYVNHPPVADAGVDQTVDEGTLVALDGTPSSDPDGDPLTFAWTQGSGPPVALSDPTTAQPTFLAPPVLPGGAHLVLRLVVSDGELDSAPDEVSIFVRSLNDPPLCELARASIELVWPPDHRMVPVTAAVAVSDGLSGPNGFTLREATSSEPDDGLGDGHTGRDIQGFAPGTTSTAGAFRAERSGQGDGRTYTLTYVGADAAGNTATCAATVRVPHASGR